MRRFVSWLRSLFRRERPETTADLVREGLAWQERERQRRLDRKLRDLRKFPDGKRPEGHMAVPKQHPALQTRRSRSLRNR